MGPRVASPCPPGHRPSEPGHLGLLTWQGFLCLLVTAHLPSILNTSLVRVGAALKASVRRAAAVGLVPWSPSLSPPGCEPGWGGSGQAQK